MTGQVRRVVTGHDADGKSVVISDGLPPQDHPMQGPEIGADFFEIWSTPEAVPALASLPGGEPTARTVMSRSVTTPTRRPSSTTGTEP